MHVHELIDVLMLLFGNAQILGGKKRKNAFCFSGEKLPYSNFKPVHCLHVNRVMHQTEKKNSKDKISEEAEFLRVSQKLNFPKTDYKSYNAPS